MLDTKQIEKFHHDGYLVVEDVLGQSDCLDPVRLEYAELLDRLIEGWVAEGRVGLIPAWISMPSSNIAM